MADYDSKEDAIFAAAEAVRALTQDKREALALVYEAAGKYGFFPPEAGGGYGKVTQTLRKPKGSNMAALVHNHPGHEHEAHGQEFFSPEDVEQAKALGIPSYIAYGKDMNISGYAPGDPVSSRRMYGKKVPATTGTPFNHIPEVKVTAKKLGTPELDGMLATAQALRKP